MGFLSGCAAGGPLPNGIASTVPEREIREAPELPGTPGVPVEITAADGSSVVATEWLPSGSPKAVILALHGFGDYGQLSFRGPAASWASSGIATIAPDQRGFGRNPSRGRWPGAEALVADARAYASQVRARFPCTPVLLLGHSMGGGVALASAPGAPVDGLILATPAIWGGNALNPIHRLASWTAATLVPERRFTGRGVVKIVATDNRDALLAIWADPHYLAPPSAREIFGLVRVTDRAASAAASVSTPALMLLGTKDQIVPNPVARDVFSRLTGPAEVIEYPEGWHLIFRDLQARTVWNDVAEWTLSLARKGCTDP